jgi:hypothetical protein
MIVAVRLSPSESPSDEHMIHFSFLECPNLLQRVVQPSEPALFTERETGNWMKKADVP